VESALKDLRVVDIGTTGAGAIATMLLADYGADVVMIEPPAGHPWRGTTAFRAWARGKRSVVAPEVSTDLLRWADVLVEDSLTEAASADDPPHLIRCSISPFGPDSWMHGNADSEALIQARFGLRHGDKGPELVGFPWASYGCAFLAAFGILAAVHARAGGAPGQRVAVSLFDGVLLLSTMQGMRIESAPDTPVAMTAGRRHLSGIHRCADGEYVGIHSGAPGAFTRGVNALGLGHKFAPSPSPMEMGVPLVGDEIRVMTEEVPAAIATMSRDELLKLMEEADVAAVPVLRPGEAFTDPQVQYNQLIVEVDDTEAGPLRQVGPPIRLAATPGGVRGGAPALGQHTTAVLAEAARAPDRVPPAAPHPVHALDGLRVIDLGQYFAGPFGPRMLSDLGADVIKVESPAGDPMRPLLSVFEAAQRGKRSVVLDLKTQPGRDALRLLAASADVVAHNFRPGVAERLGVGPADLRAVNPRLVYCANHGWGASGPRAHLQSFAPLLQGFSGLSVIAAGEDNPPVTIGPNEDYFNAMLGGIGILMALIHRRSSGVGQLVESPQLNSCLFAVTHIMTDLDGKVLPYAILASDRRGFDLFTRIYPTRSGWLCVDCQSDTQRAKLLEALGLADEDRSRPGLDAEMRSRMTSRPADEWITVFRNFEIPCDIAATGSYLSTELWDDPRHRRIGRVVGQSHPDVGPISEIGTLIHLSHSEIPVRGPAPRRGEHTAEVLQELEIPIPS
jgi:crotonobetainyl-CoA:carnitine CoA-transferase CaiB-like acyl-CoA transferase